MRAIRLHAPGQELRSEEVPMPEPMGTEVRIRVAGCGVCRTDLHIVDGTQARVTLPITLGHEIAGWVDAVGPDVQAGPALDSAILVHGGWGCGECRECRAGAEQRCMRSKAPGFQVDGGYADAVLVPHPRHLVALGSLGPVRAAPLADAGVTPYRAVRRAERWLVPGARVLLIGCGALGRFALQYLRLTIAGPELKIVVRELSAARLDHAEALGADVVLLEGDAVASVLALGGAADVVLDFVGTDATLDHAASAIAPDGLVVLVGEAGGSLPFGFAHAPVESWLTTVAWGSHDDLREVVRLAEDDLLRWDVETVPLAEAAAAHRRLRSGVINGRLVLVP
ncbi:MAG TPA: alcohol dehydrogenase catalytic domain-containing protein [Candidatus Limnocylindrales bacterium]|nr:alcohol dehydrogenase catalytic domain-containing protein [Candidatus Limnocylindrales bacterium]